MKVCFIGQNHNNLLRNEGKKVGLYCCAHGLAEIFDGDCWNGGQWNNKVLDEILKYDTILVNSNTGLLPLMWELGKRCIGILEASIHFYIEGGVLPYSIPNASKQDLIKAIRACKAFGSLQESNVDFLKKMAGVDHVFWSPLPCEPREFYINRPKEKKIVIQGRTFDLDYSLIPTRNCGYPITVFANSSHGQDLLYGIPADIRNLIDYRRHADFVSTCRVGIRMDYAYTDGRFQKLCAGLGVACIGSNRTEAQELLFPDLTFDLLNSAAVARAIKQLMEDDLFFTKVTEEAKNKLFDIYSIEKTRERMLQWMQ